MNKYKKYAKLLSLVGLLLLLTGITYSFFNYTRTGVANRISVGRISFVTNQSATINLTNVFPIDRDDIDTDTTNVDEVVIEITGDTDYVGGIEYLVSSVDSSIYTSSGQLVPISLDVEVDDLGTSNTNYFTARESTNVSIYKQLVGNTLAGDQMLLVGYIIPNTTSGTAEGIDGSITIKAFFDNEVIAISDTYDGNESDLNGTTNEWVDDRYVLTTSEWNAIQTNGVSFKIKVEANEGIWVNGSLEEIMKKTAVMDNINSTYVNNQTPGIDFGEVSSDTNGKGIYIRKGTEDDDYPIMYYRGDVEDNNVSFGGHCWKTVRTTDTGGVKLIYNGELSYNKKLLTEEEYDTPLSNTNNTFTFDLTDNSWNGTIAENHYYNDPLELSFSLPAGYEYDAEMEINFTPNGREMVQLESYLNSTYLGNVHAGIYDGFVQDGDILNAKVSFGEISNNDVIYFKLHGYGIKEGSLGSVKIKIFQSDTELGTGCDNVGLSTYASLIENGVKTSTFAYNTENNLPSYSGYMFGDIYVSSDTQIQGTEYFGSGFTWDGSQYKLTDATVTEPDATHHYSCNLADPNGTCLTIRYVSSYIHMGTTYKRIFYMELTNGDGIEEAFDKMFKNEHNSNAKAKVETWYGINLASFQDKLEDTIWCNDRSIAQIGGFSPTGLVDAINNSANVRLIYNGYVRSSAITSNYVTIHQPSLVCINKSDSFTWRNSKGNQKLEYPVALLTNDELMLAGAAFNHSNLYLGGEYTSYFHTMTPATSSLNAAGIFGIYESANGGSMGVTNNFGLRPAISLKPGQLIKSGTGTVTDPYVIE